MGFIAALMRRLRGLPDVDGLQAKGDIDGLLEAVRHQHEGTKQSAQAALLSLWKADAERVRAHLLAAISAPAPLGSRRGDDAGTALGTTKDAAAVDPLIELIGHANPSVRYTAIYALGAIGDTRAQGPVLAELRRDEGDANHWSRVAAASSLASLGPPSRDVIEALAEASVSDYKHLREAARRSLTTLGHGELADGLTKAFLNAHSAAIMKEALRRSLGEMGKGGS